MGVVLYMGYPSNGHFFLKIGGRLIHGVVLYMGIYGIADGARENTKLTITSVFINLALDCDPSN